MKCNFAHHFHGSNNVDVAVQDHSQGDDEAEYEQVDDVRSCVCIVGVPIDGTAESASLSTRFPVKQIFVLSYLTFGTSNTYCPQPNIGGVVSTKEYAHIIKTIK